MAVGDWIGLYGQQGYVLWGATGTDGQRQAPQPAGAWPNDALNFLENVNIHGFGQSAVSTPSGTAGDALTWDQGSADGRALQRVSGGRVAATLTGHSTDQHSVINVTGYDNAEWVGVMRLYFVDFDNLGRSQTVAVADADGTDTRTLDAATLAAGTWQSYNVRIPAGLTGLTVTLDALSGNGVVISGLFLDAPLRPTAIASSAAVGTPKVLSTPIDRELFSLASLQSYWKLAQASLASAAADGADSNPGTYVSGSTSVGNTGLIAGESETSFRNTGGGSGGVNISDAANLKPTAITVFAVMKSDVAYGGYTGTIFQRNGHGYRLYAGARSGTRYRLVFGVFDSSGVEHTATSAGLITDNLLHVVAGSFDGTTIKVYVDGQLVGSTAWTGAIDYAAGSASIGRQPGANSNVYDGYLEKVALFNAALSDADELALYHAVVVPQPVTGAGAIATAAAFGTPIVARVQAILPSGIGSAEAFGAAELGRTIRAAGIASAAAFGTPAINPPQRVSDAGGIFDEAIGVPTVTEPGPTTIVPTGIASSEAFGTARTWRASDPQAIAPRELLWNPVANTSYEWAINHSTEDALRVGVRRDLGGPNVQVAIVRQQSYDGALKLHLEGFIFDPAQLAAFTDFFNDSEDVAPLIYRDAAGEEFWVAITALDTPKQRLRGGHYWRYTMELDVLAVLAGVYAGVT